MLCFAPHTPLPGLAVLVRKGEHSPDSHKNPKGRGRKEGRKEESLHSPGGNPMWDKGSCSHQDTHSFPPTSPRGSNPTQTPSPAAFQLLPQPYSTAVQEFLCSATISPHIPVPSPLLHPSPSQLHTTPYWGRRAGGSWRHQTPTRSTW